MREAMILAWMWAPVMPPVLLAAVALLAATVCAWSFKEAFGAQRAKAVAILLLRLISLAALFVFFLNPSAENSAAPSTPASSIKPALVLVIDSSRSMNSVDEGPAPKMSRIEFVKSSWLSPANLSRLADHFDVKLVTIDSALREWNPENSLVKNFSELSASGDASSLRTLLPRAIELARASHGHVVLWSDGHDTTGVRDAESIPEDMTVDAVVLGSDSKIQLRIAVRGIPSTLRTDEPGAIHFNLSGAPSSPVIVTIIGTGTGQRWRSQTTLSDSGRMTLYLPTGEKGLDERVLANAGWKMDRPLDAEELARIHRVSALRGEGGDWYEVSASSGEEKASASLFVAREPGPWRILLIEGRPTWDMRELSRSLASMADVELTRVIAVSNRQDSDSSDATVTAPSTVGGWRRFDAVILGASVETLIGAGQGESLAEYVREQGGRLLLTRGRETTDGPAPMWLGAMSPVKWTNETVTSATLQWPDDGVGHRIEGRWERAETLPGANVWARVETDRGTWPAIAESPLGRGRVMALTGDGYWRWWHDERESDFFRKFWRRLIVGRLIGRDELVGEQLRIRVEEAEGKSINIGRPVMLRAQILGELSQPAPAIDATIDGPLNDANPTVERVKLSHRAEMGRHEWSSGWTAKRAGVYRVRLAENAVPQASTFFHVALSDVEAEDVSPDVDFLRTITKKTNGILLDSQASSDWVSALIQRTKSQEEKRIENREREWISIWQRPWVLVAVLAVLLVEWAVRRALGWR